MKLEEFEEKHKEFFERIGKKLEYWKKHNRKKYEEMLKYIKIAEGKVV